MGLSKTTLTAAVLATARTPHLAARLPETTLKRPALSPRVAAPPNCWPNASAGPMVTSPASRLTTNEATRRRPVGA